jgi:hypothetical protein
MMVLRRPPLPLLLLLAPCCAAAAAAAPAPAAPGPPAPGVDAAAGRPEGGQPPAAAVTDPRYVPAFHQRPPCYNGLGPTHVGDGQSPHDIAGALYLPDTKTWHVMAGCWQYPLGGWRTNLGGWQHMTSLDLVHWRLGTLFDGHEGGRSCNATHRCNTSLGLSGGLALDDDGRAFAYYGAKPLWVHRATDTTLEHWEPRQALWNKSRMNLSHSVGPGDPVMWRGKQDKKWYAVLAERLQAGGRGAACNATAPCGGFEELCVGSSPYDNRSWSCTNRSLLSLNQRSMLPAIIPHRVASGEFITPDYFGELRGDPYAGTAGEAKCFLTSNYGAGPKVNATQWNKHAHGYVNATVQSGFGYASMVLGTQQDGEALDVDWDSATAVDYSCFTPNASSRSSSAPGGLDVAVTHGGPSFGCCPKTASAPLAFDGGSAAAQSSSVMAAAAARRRVLFGWLQHGYMSVPRLHCENTLTLPRDLSVVTAPSGKRELRQHFVPELQVLRRGAPFRLPSQRIDSSPAAVPLRLRGVNGTQLEIKANFSLRSAFEAPSRFGLWVLAGPASSSSNSSATERTAIEFDSKSKLVSIDRRFSGNRNDSDVRAGPWPKVDYGNSDAPATDLHVHAFVDRSIVEVIVNGQTAITVYVHPRLADSVGLALFADGGDVTASVEVHQMASAPLIARYK